MDDGLRSVPTAQQALQFNKDSQAILKVPHMLVRSLSAKYRPDRYRRYKSVKFGTELP